jgi:type IV pilus assembly protein PilW
MRGQRPWVRPQRGLTIIELMIGMALALLLTGVSAMIAVNSKTVFRANVAVARLQDNARFAVDSLSRDLRMAGFGACAGTAKRPVNVLSAGGFQYDYTNGLLGSHAIGASWSPALDASVSGLTPAPLAGTDVLTVRTETGGAHALTAVMPASTSALTISTGSGLAAGDIVMAASCSKSVAFQITGDPSLGTVAHAAGLGSPGNASADLGTSFSTDSSLYRLVTRSYFVAPSALQPGTTSLWSYSVPNYTTAAQPQEIVEGVQNLQLLFGEDTDGDGVPNRYVTADLVGTWSNVIAVRVQVLMQSVQDNMATMPQPYTFNGTTVTPVDRRIRTVMNSTISVRNRIR